MTAPTISGLDNISLDEGTVTHIGDGVTFTGGLGYPGGSVTFGVGGSNQFDLLTLTSAPDPLAVDAVSVDGSDVYLGTGVGKQLIGTIDATENGQDGNPLTIHFAGESTGVFRDSSFESDDPVNGWATEWTPTEARVIFGVDTIAGWATPVDPTRPFGKDNNQSPGDADPMTDPLVFDVQLVSGGDNAHDGNRGLRLFSGDDTDDSGSANSVPYGVIRGPYVVSDAFAATQGDILRFDWKAEGGDDAFDAFGYLLNADTGQTVICLDQSGNGTGAVTPWATASVIVPTSGNWQFVFVSGSFDWSGGRLTGGSLYIDNFSVQRSSVTDAILQTIASQVTYENTSDEPQGPRTVEVSVRDGSGNEGSANADLDITSTNDLPTGTVTVTGTVAQGETLTATNDIADPDGTNLPTVSYHWERWDGTAWQIINGATSDQYTLTEADVGHPVRAVADYVDGDTGETGGIPSAGTVAVVNVNDAPGGDVTVTGTAAQGEVLTAANDITDPDGVGTISYRWQREVSPGNWVDIADADDATYTLTEADVGHAVRAVASYTDGHGTAEQVASNETTAVGNVNDAPGGDVTVTGTAAQGEVLTATNDITDPDGVGTVSYRWQREVSPGNWVDIADADDATYTLTEADVGHAVRAVASYTDGHGTAEQVASNETTAVGNVNDAPGGDVTVTGTAAQGEVLTAANDITDPDGVGTISYRWQREVSPGNWVDIADADDATYTLTEADVGHAVRAVASYTDGHGTAEQVASNETTAVGNVNDAPGGDVTVTGTAAQGEVLTATNDITDPDGVGTVSYRWQREVSPGDWVDIADADDASYTLTEADVGHAVRTVASYTDGHGAAEQVASNETTAVGNANDAPGGDVTVTGTAAQGEVLTATNDITDVDGPESLVISYQWQREVTPDNWVDIDGADDATYTLTQDDVGHAVRAVASYTDGHGTAEQVASNETTAVGNVNDVPAGTVTVDGDARQGEVLTASNDLADLDGPDPLVIGYQWQRQDDDGHWVDIAGATQATYTLTQDDVDHQLRVVAQYTDDGGATEAVPSAPTAAVENVNDAPVAAGDSFPAVAADGGSITIDVLANDTDLDGDTLTITQVNGRAITIGGSLEITGGLVRLNGDGHLVFTPSITFDGTAHFTYTADDGHGGVTTGTVSGQVTAAAAWDDFGDQLDAVLGEHGSAAPDYVNNLLYIASVVSPGAFHLTDGSNGTGAGYQAGLGYDLTPSLATPDADLLARSLAALIQAQEASDAPALLTGSDGDGWGSAVDQSLLFQSKLGVSSNVQIDFTDGTATFSDAASLGWSRQFAQMVLRADFSEGMIGQLDGRAQGQLHQMTVGQGSELSVDIGGQAAGTPQVALSNAFGMADFVTADGNSAIEVARAVAVAATVDGSDDQSAIVRMRQGGTLDLQLQFYKVDDFTGAIDGLRPGDAGYAAAATARAYHTDTGATSLSGGGFGKYSEGVLVGIDHDDLIAMRLSNGTQEFFAFAQANETVNGQAVGHLWSYGMNTWGWEDLAGGGDRDFNDLIVQLDFTSHHDSLLG